MSAAALIRPEVLNDAANQMVCSTLRRNVLAVMAGPMFTRYERVKAKLNTVQCTDAGQLHRWYANVQRARQQREAACQYAAHEGTYTTGLDRSEADDMEADYTECDQD